MNRYYIDKKFIADDAIAVTDAKEIHHLTCVLRMNKGEQLFISDGEGGAYVARLNRASKKEVLLKIEESLQRISREKQRVRMSLACAVPRNARLEDILDKATQLGADEIIPLLTQRTLVKKESVDKKSERFRRMIVAAAKQSGCLFLPVLREAVPFEALLQEVPQYDLSLMAYLSEDALTLQEAVASFDSGRILIFIGPEGDFTDKEIQAALRRGARGISLGGSVLKVDTAAIAVMSYLRLRFGL